MSSDFPSKRLVFCHECGNKGMMEEIASHEMCVSDEDDLGREFILEEVLYQLFSCPVCGSVILLASSKYWGNGNEDPIYCYPNVDVDYTGVPDKIRDAFKSAIATKNIDIDICLLSLRRALEMICKDQGATDANLKQKISQLEKENIISPTIAKVCMVVRELGNGGAHGDDPVINEYDLNRIIEYVYTIIKYVYVIPSKVSKDLEKFCDFKE